MDITTIQPSVSALPQAPSLPVQEAAQRRQLHTAAKSINDSGLLGRNQIVFLLDRKTHRPIIRVEDRDTHEVLLQIPPEYVLRLAQELNKGSAQTTEALADT